MLERQESWTRDYDEVQFNPSMGIVGFQKLGTCLWKAHAEHIGNYYPDIGIFRWAWALRPPTAKSTRVDAVLREGETYGMEQLTSNHVNGVNDDDAALLANVAAHLSKAEGVWRTVEDEHFVYYALYEAEPNTIPPPRGLSVPPPGQPGVDPKDPFGSAPPPPLPSLPSLGSQRPPQAPSDGGVPGVLRPSSMPAGGAAPPAKRSAPPPTAYSSVAPPTPHASFVPPTPQSFVPPARPVREPGRALLTPLAQRAIADITEALGEYEQAIVVLNVSRSETRGQFFVVLTAVDASGELQAPVPSDATVRCAARLVRDDTAEGNGPWRRLVMRILPKAGGGASMIVQVA